mmetsp:Transcript_20056/g.76797  ORF Transcript_20056/g.76797 Transcript_20056/m.76797 type:complete len:204 (+) Transcript_20056:812-1423(+)
MSTLFVCLAPSFRISGACHPRVPGFLLEKDCWCLSSFLPSPMSEILMTFLGSRRTFWGLRSRCTIWREWRWATPEAICLTRPAMSSSVMSPSKWAAALVTMPSSSRVASLAAVSSPVRVLPFSFPEAVVSAPPVSLSVSPFAAVRELFPALSAAAVLSHRSLHESFSGRLFLAFFSSALFRSCCWRAASTNSSKFMEQNESAR